MTSKKIKAVVLKVSDLGESDKIVTFYSREYGKVAGIAKGAKRSKKRFSNKLEIFSLLDILYTDRSRPGLFTIAEAGLLNPFMSLRQNYDRYVGAALACELIYYWSRDYDADSEIFDLLIWVLQNIDKGQSSRVILIFFQIKLYTLLGYKPDLSGCIKCGTAGPAGKPYVFHSGRHGLLCKNCGPSSGSRETVSLSMNTVKLLEHAQGAAIEKLERLRFSDASIREAQLLFRMYGQYLLQREIKAFGFLEEI